jgi:hypothetical protein
MANSSNPTETTPTSDCKRAGGPDDARGASNDEETPKEEEVNPKRSGSLEDSRSG